MNLSAFVQDGREYVFDGKYIRRIVGGGISVVWCISLIPLLALMGYFMQILIATVVGSGTPPKLGRSLKYIRRGAAAVVIGFVYIGLFTGLAFFTSSVISLTVFTDTVISVNDAALVLATAGVIGIATAFYLAPMGLIIYIQTQSIRRAVNVFSAYQYNRELPYTTKVYFLSIMQLGGVLFGTYFLIEVFGIILVLIFPFLLFIHTVMVFRWYGLIASYTVDEFNIANLSTEFIIEEQEIRKKSS